MSSEHPSAAAHAEEHHEHSAIPYHLTLVALLILTGLTVGASYIHFGSDSANVTIALAIATVKATLVALIFMHLLGDKPVNGIIAIGGFIFLAILLSFSLMDFSTRRDPSPRNVPNMEKGATPVPDTMNPQLAPAPNLPTTVAPPKAEAVPE